MEIANPIYDVIFKYLMEDNEIAALIISTITGEDIVELEFLPQERTVEVDRRSFTVYRMDFSARVRDSHGDYKNVIIEIQKAKLATDIMRFRRYLGRQYESKDNAYMAVEGGIARKKAMPLLNIYFLGYALEHINVPVIKVSRNYYDVSTGEEIKEREEFIESLSHDSFVIQIPCLRRDAKTDVERLLSVFDQSHVTSDGHRLNIKEEDHSEDFRKVIRRLQRAILEPEMRDKMDVEDDILEELQGLERAIAGKDKVIEGKKKALEEKDKVLEEKDRALEEKDRALEEKDKALEEKDKALDKNKKTLDERDKIIEELKKRLSGA